jgi:tetratricopeptide (TPR) repeat protein
MRSRLFILYFLFVSGLLFTHNVSAQTHRIDSLRKQIPVLDGTSKVHCLNAIAQQFIYYCIHADSALKYARAANELASHINDNSGKAIALIAEADAHGRLLGTIPLMIRYSRHAIDLSAKVHDPINLSKGYYTLALALALEGNYRDAHAAAATAKKISLSANDRLGQGRALQATGFIYSKNGEYWKSFENLVESYEIGKQLNDSSLQALALAFIARAFNRAGDPDKALSYYYQFLPLATPFILIWPHLEDMAYSHLKLKNYDSVAWYQQKHRQNLAIFIKDARVKKRFDAWSWGLSTDLQVALGQYDKVLAELSPGLAQLRQSKNVIQLMHSLLNLGKAYEAKGNLRSALIFGRELYLTASKVSNKEYLMEANGLLSGVFNKLQKPDSAFHYLAKFTLVKDSLATTKFRERTALYQAASDAETRIRILKKDNEISGQQLALNKKELLKQSQLRNMLTVGIVVLFLLSIAVVRNFVLKRKNEALQNQQQQLVLKRRALELEMQALRAQMNPHFIFNCLSAIDNLIQTNQPDKATTYLSRFAKLIRGILDSSKNNLVSFHRDFETMKLYLEIEEFRCNNKFRFQLSADEELFNGDYKVPPLVIQPFIENAIHHGLMNKGGSSRYLDVNAKLENDDIIYSVRDNGIGRKHAMRLREINKPGQQSYGIEITKERIQLHNQNRGVNDLLITDLEEAGVATGTEVIVRVNCFPS